MRDYGNVRVGVVGSNVIKLLFDYQLLEFKLSCV